MTATAFLALLPLIMLAVAAIVVMLVIAFRREHALAAGLALIGLAIAFVADWLAPAAQVTALLVIDGYARFFIGLILAASFAVTLFSYGYLENQDDNREEFYVLVLLATLGSMVLVASSHFVSFFLGLEILSVSLYAMIAWEEGSFHINPGEHPCTVTVSGSTEGLLMEGFRRLDEARREGADRAEAGGSES